MSDPEYFERWRYLDTINDYNSILEEFQKQYEQTPATDRFARARIKWNEEIKKGVGKNSPNMTSSRNTRLELQ
jgi:hypothetical protein